MSRLEVTSAAQGVYDTDAATLRSVSIISAVVGLILLLVCANIANLLLSRAAARQKEIAVRLSIGATRLRLVRQLLTESILLAIAGGAFGVLVAYWGRQLLPTQVATAPLDWRVLLFAMAVALTTGIVFGIAPALRVTSTSAGEALKDTSRSVIGSRTLLSKSLLVVQVAISLVLLIGAGLFLRTVDNLRRVDVGFNPDNLVLFRVNPQLNGYEPTRIEALYQQVTERLLGVPGVRSVTLSNPPMLTGSVNGTQFIVQGRTYGPEYRDDPRLRATISVNRVRIAPNFFETMEIPVVRGRALHGARQRAGAESGNHQRGCCPEVLPDRRRPGQAVRHHAGNQQSVRDRRGGEGHHVQRPARAAAGDDVCAIRAEPGWGDGVHHQDGRRSGHDDGAGARSRAAGRRQRAAHGHVDADRPDRAALCAGAACSRRRTRSLAVSRCSSHQSASSV